MKYFKYIKLKKNGGFTLLYSTLVISIILAIALAIADISMQQFLLASAGKESQVAFYNADTGVECALYHDLKMGIFPASQTELNNFNTTINCANMTGTIASKTFSSPTSTVVYIFKDSNTCGGNTLLIEVNKSPIGVNTETFFTHIRSRGYNSCDTSNPRRVERGLEVRY
jgi:competence protein ComGC